MIKSPSLTIVSSRETYFKSPSDVVKRLLYFILGVAISLNLSSCGQPSDSQVPAEIGLILILEVDRSGQESARVILKSTLTNLLAEPVVFLPWNTPFDKGVNGRFLSIVDASSNIELVYQGRMVKRRPPELGDYITLNAGESLTNALDVSTSYNFCANTVYRLTFSGSLNDYKSNALSVGANSVELTLGDTFEEC